MKYAHSMSNAQALEVIKRWKEATDAYEGFIKEYISVIGQDEIAAYRECKEAVARATAFEEEVDRHNEPEYLQLEWANYYGPEPHGDDSRKASSQAKAAARKRRARLHARKNS